MALQELAKPRAQAKDELDLENSSRIVLDFSGIADFTNNLLFKFCRQNDELKIERTKEGRLIIEMPTGTEGGDRESTLIYLLEHWNRKYKLGKVFSSSTGFILPDNSMKSPDVSFIQLHKWKEVPESLRKKFAPICPDFVAELRSESDKLQDCKEKMDEWMANGCHLAWLIDPINEKAYIYRQGHDIELVSSFDGKLSGEDILPQFELDLSEFKTEIINK